MDEFREIAEGMAWLQAASLLGVLLVLGILAILLFAPGVMAKDDPRKIEKTMGLTLLACAAIAGAAVLPFKLAGTEERLAAACQAVWSDISAGEVDARSDALVRTAMQTCGKSRFRFFSSFS